MGGVQPRADIYGIGGRTAAATWAYWTNTATLAGGDTPKYWLFNSCGMLRRSLLRAGAGALLAGGSGGVGGCLNREHATFENPVFEPTLADPSIIRVPEDGRPQRAVTLPSDGYRGTFYAYGTEDRWFGEKPEGAPGLPRGPIVKSDDLVEWEFAGEVFEEKPGWKESGGIWAPDIAYHDGEFRYYYAYSVWDDPNPAIGVASSPAPAGPFEDQGKLFDSEEIGVRNSIDPMFLRVDGTPYLVWGSWHGIWGVELAPDGLSVAGEPFRIAANNHFEAPYIIRRDGYYYFFASNGHCCNGRESDYHVVVARAESFEGPYYSKRGDDISRQRGTTILKGNEDGFVGPGHNAIIQDDAGRDYIVYHAYENGKYWLQDSPRRTLMLEPIEWIDGWPTVGDGTPTAEPPAPSIRR